MTTDSPVGQPSPPPTDHLRLLRWSCSMGSAVQTRATVVVESGGHRWQATGKGTGAVDALFRAVDAALHDVLTGHPRLVSYDVHALAEGPDAEGRVTVQIAPPEGAGGERASGTYDGVAHGTNIIAASIQAYIEAIEKMLGEEHWQGATDAAGKRSTADKATEAERADYDPKAGTDHSRWWT